MHWKSKLLAASGLGCIILFSLLLPLHPDEAYYWVWSHNLALSYLDHPPLIAYLIKLATVSGDSVFQIRLVAVVCISLVVAFTYKMADRLFGKPVADKVLFLFFGLPLILAAWVTTPDSPLLLFWAATLYFFYQGLTQGTRYFYYAGLSAGLMLLSKYTGVLLLFSLLIFLLVSPDYRKHLFNKHIYLAFGLTALLFLPVIIWNSQHDWSSFHFQLARRMEVTDSLFNLNNLLRFWLGQAGIFNPIFFFTLLFYCVKERKNIWNNTALLYLFIPFAFTILFFAACACIQPSHPNWPVPAYLSGIILLAYWWQTFNKTKLYIVGIVLNILLMVIAVCPEQLSFLPSQATLKMPFLGYKEIFQAGSRYVDQDTVVVSDSYQHASEAWYYLKNKPRVHILSLKHFSNYNYWNRWLLNRRIKKIIYFIDVDNVAGLQEGCQQAKWLETLRYKSKHSKRTLAVYQCTALSSQLPYMMIVNRP